MASGILSFQGTGLELGHFLSYLSRRQEIVASNIANADTPGFRTRDVAAPDSFSRTFEDVQNRDSPNQVFEVEGLTSHNDGNNVSMDREARLLAENTIRFNVASQLLRSQLKGIRSAIEEGRS